jgi:hypothetical protein
MPAISNLNKAHKQINQQMLDHEGLLTIGVAKSFFDKAVTDFKLNEEKAAELRAMKFDRAVDEGTDEIKRPEATLESQAVEIENLKACLSEIATLSGYANYLSKYGLKRTEPTKRK